MRSLPVVMVLILALVGCGDEQADPSIPTEPNRRDMGQSTNDSTIDTLDMRMGGDQLDAGTEADQALMPAMDGGAMDAATGNDTTPQFGELKIMEIMYDPDGLDDDFAEWIEVHNTSSRNLDLTGCTFSDRNAQNDDSVPVAPLGNGLLGSGQILLFARSNDPSVNGGLSANGIFEFSLSNGGDELILTCGEIEVDVVSYDDGDVFPNAKGFSIVRGTDPASGQERWCPSTSVYDAATNQLGTPGEANDQCGTLEGDACFAQIDCAEGRFCMSGRCGLPPGQCETNLDCVGAEVCLEQRCQSMPECSDTNPCAQGQMCVDGLCMVEGGCMANSDCLAGQMCVNGSCLENSNVSQPSAGQVLITEFMYDPHGPVENRLDDTQAEWIEMLNTSSTTLNLGGCILQDGSTVSTTIPDLSIEPGRYVLAVRSNDQSINGQLAADFTFDFALNNSTDEISLTCDGGIVDRVSYSDPTEPAQAYQRSVSDLGGNGDAEALWCGATVPYLADPEHLGTPGQANEVCP